jgi:peptidoglycan LD-endopeptidase LytH
MKRGTRQRALPVAAVFVAFCAGMVVSWGLYHYGPPLPTGTAVQAGTEVRAGPEAAPPPSARVGSSKTEPVASGSIPADTPTVPIPTTGRISAPPLRMPLDGVAVDTMKGGFEEKRGARPHEAADLLAPRNTPVHAVEGGTIAKLFVSKQGGFTIYQFDPASQVCYYYAHLDHYADGLHEGQTVAAGDVIGFVGTTGNAPPNTPHLHFAVFELNDDRQWWKGRAVDPYPLFKSRAGG